MKKMIMQSVTMGLILGTLFFALAPLGLGLSFVEIMKPVLAPGAYLVRFSGTSTAGIIPIALALLLNVLIYSLLVMGILVTRSHFTDVEK